MKTAQFTEPVYNTTVVLMWDGTRESMATEIIDKYDPEYDDDGDYQGLCVEATVNEPGALANRHVIIILIPNWSALTTSINTLAHECFHATEYVMKYRGIPHSEPSSEAWAYYFDFLFAECLRTLGKYEHVDS